MVGNKGFCLGTESVGSFRVQQLDKQKNPFFSMDICITPSIVYCFFVFLGIARAVLRTMKLFFFKQKKKLSLNVFICVFCGPSNIPLLFFAVLYWSSAFSFVYHTYHRTKNPECSRTSNTKFGLEKNRKVFSSCK